MTLRSLEMLLRSHPLLFMAEDTPTAHPNSATNSLGPFPEPVHAVLVCGTPGVRPGFQVLPLCCYQAAITCPPE